MAGTVFFHVTMSLDGYIAPKDVPVQDLFGPSSKPDDPDVQRWLSQWSELHRATFPLRFFRENLQLGEGGEEGLDDDLARATHERTGAHVMGRRMFDAGELSWPAEAPFHTPVFVVTHHARDPWERPGGTTFHFVDEGTETALDLALAAAGERDVRISGGGATILQYLNGGLVDELTITLSPVLLGSGTRLFEGIDADRVTLEPLRSQPSPSGVTHLTYAVRERPAPSRGAA